MKDNEITYGKETIKFKYWWSLPKWLIAVNNKDTDYTITRYKNESEGIHYILSKRVYSEKIEDYQNKFVQLFRFEDLSIKENMIEVYNALKKSK